MARPFSLAHLTVLDCTPAQAAHIAADAGYDFVSFRIIPLELPGERRYALASDKAMLREAKAALRDTGLPVLDIEIANVAGDHDIKLYEPSLEVAAELGAKHVVTGGFGKHSDHVVERFAQLCRLASPYGLTVDLEFITFYQVATLPQVHAIVRESGAPNAGVLVDMLHFQRSHTKFAELAAVPREFFHFAQLCDAPEVTRPSRDDLIRTAREERLYLGEGDIPIAKVLAHLPPIPCSIEIANARRQRELGYGQFARACLEHARAYFAREGEKTKS